jgi:hypothetical protein
MFYKLGEREKRGQCKGFSFSSRRRMLNRLNCISAKSPLPEFITLTLPDAVFDDSVTSFAKKAKHWLDVWLKRLRRVVPDACGFWRIEWKARKSGLYEGKLFPHFHLMIWGIPWRQRGVRFDKDARDYVPNLEAVVPIKDQQVKMDFMSHLFEAVHAVEGPGATANHQRNIADLGDDEEARLIHDSEGRVISLRCRKSMHQRFDDKVFIQPLSEEHLCPGDDRMLFADWVAVTWYHVVESFDPAHFSAGSRVEKVRTWGGVMSYCSKYVAKLDDSDFLTQVPAGRMWGIFNRAAVPWGKMVELQLPNDVGVRLRRVARRYLERVSGRRRIFPYGITLYIQPEKLAPLWCAPDTPF